MRSGSHAIQLGVGPDSTSPRATRRMFAAHFADHPRLDDLLLCLSEVVTNAVLHAGPPIMVTGGVVDKKVRVEVSDGSKAAPVRAASRPVVADRPRTVAARSSDVGVGRRDTSDGKTVWFEIAGGMP